MNIFPGLYRARCISVAGDTFKVHIPQVFGTELIPMTSRTGAIPAPHTAGWVAFESGEAAYPVWVSNGISAVAALGDPTGTAESLVEAEAEIRATEDTVLQEAIDAIPAPTSGPVWHTVTDSQSLIAYVGGAECFFSFPASPMPVPGIMSIEFAALFLDAATDGGWLGGLNGHHWAISPTLLSGTGSFTFDPILYLTGGFTTFDFHVIVPGASTGTITATLTYPAAT